MIINTYHGTQRGSGYRAVTQICAQFVVFCLSFTLFSFRPTRAAVSLSLSTKDENEKRRSTEAWDIFLVDDQSISHRFCFVPWLPEMTCVTKIKWDNQFYPMNPTWVLLRFPFSLSWRERNPEKFLIDNQSTSHRFGFVPWGPEKRPSGRVHWINLIVLHWTSHTESWTRSDIDER